MFVLLRGCSGDDTIFLNVLRSSSDPWSNNEIPVLTTGAGFLPNKNPVIFRSCWRRGGFLFISVILSIALYIWIPLQLTFLCINISHLKSQYKIFRIFY